jgi:CBS domain-containing protein
VLPAGTTARALADAGESEMLVGEIMARALEFIAPDASVQDAAVLMGELDLGALPVGSAEDLQGILTDRDILFRVAAAGRDATRVRVREVMSTTVFNCKETDTLETAMDIMGAYHVRRLPVVDEGARVVGWVTLSDIARRLLLATHTVETALHELSAKGGQPGGTAAPGAAGRTAAAMH